MTRLLLLLTIGSFVPQLEAKLPKTVYVNDKEMKLCTEHTIRYALLVKIAYVGLYKPACDMNQNILEIPEKLIRFNYQVDVKASVFQELAVKYFKKNIDEELYQLYSDELKQFNKSYVDISANDSYDLFHENGKKLSLYKNKKLLGYTEWPDFAANYFKIWFGKTPAVKKLKETFSEV